MGCKKRYATEDNIRTLIELLKDKFENYLTEEEFMKILSEIPSISFEVVPFLPEVGKTNVIYLISQNYDSASNIYDEYFWIKDYGRFELIGTARFGGDFSDFIIANDEEVRSGFEKEIEPYLNKSVNIKVGE